MPFYLQSMNAQNGDRLQGQRQVMPRWLLWALLVRRLLRAILVRTEGTGHSNHPSALPSLVLPPLSMLFVSSQGEGQYHSN